MLIAISFFYQCLNFTDGITLAEANFKNNMNTTTNNNKSKTQ